MKRTQRHHQKLPSRFLFVLVLRPRESNRAAAGHLRRHVKGAVWRKIRTMSRRPLATRRQERVWSLFFQPAKRSRERWRGQPAAVPNRQITISKTSLASFLSSKVHNPSAAHSLSRVRHLLHYPPPSFKIHPHLLSRAMAASGGRGEDPPWGGLCNWRAPFGGGGVQQKHAAAIYGLCRVLTPLIARMCVRGQMIPRRCWVW